MLVKLAEFVFDTGSRLALTSGSTQLADHRGGEGGGIAILAKWQFTGMCTTLCDPVQVLWARPGPLLL